VYIPPSVKVNSSLNPYQQPYAIQAIIESKLAEKFALLPTWISGSCHLALRKFFCGTYFLKPQAQHFYAYFRSLAASMGVPYAALLNKLNSDGYNVTGLLHYQPYLPSYPAYSVCTDFVTKCSSLIQLKSSLAVNCSATTSSGQPKYPKTNITVTNMTLQVSSTSSQTLYLYTSPNPMSTSNDGSYTPQSFKAPGSCEYAPSDDTDNVCISLVDYSFFVPVNKTYSDISAIALSKLSSPKLNVLPIVCQAAIKRFL